MRIDDFDNDYFDLDTEEPWRIDRREPDFADERDVSPPVGRKLGTAARIALGVASVGEVVIAGAFLQQMLEDAGAFRIRRMYVFCGMAETLLFFVATLLFMLWLSKAYRNAERLGRRRLSWTSGMAIAGFFIPFANLVIPYSVTQEIWMASDPGPSEDDDIGQRVGTRSILIIAWWGLLVVAIIIHGAAVFSTNGTRMATLFIVWHTLLAIDAVLAILVIGAISRRQEARWQALVARGTAFGVRHFDPES